MALSFAARADGLTVDGAWMPNTEYNNPRVRAQIIGEITAMIAEFQNERPSSTTSSRSGAPICRTPRR